MRHTTTAILAGAAGLALGAVAMTGFAQEDLARGFGFHRSYEAEETYDLSVGVNTVGRPRPPELRRETRTAVVFPSHYGDLFQVTQDGRDAILWFRASDGTVRNTVLDAASSVPYEVQSSPTIKLEVKTR